MASRRPAQRSRRSSGKKQTDRDLSSRQQMDKNDNKMAIQILVGCVIACLLIFGLFSLGDDDPIPKKKKREGPVFIPGDNRESPKEDSEVPIWLAEQFMIALGNEDEEAISKLMVWDLLFAKIDNLNNRQPGERYEDLDVDAKRTLRDKYLTKVIDPDFSFLIKEHALEQLLAGQFTWDTADIALDYGNVSMMVQDARGRDKLLIMVKTQLLPGKHTVHDSKDKSAWGIVTILHQLQGKVNAEGAKIRMRKKSFADDLYKKKKKKRKKRFYGPPEADPKLVDWPTGMNESTKGTIEGQVAELVSTTDFRKADRAKVALIDRGKSAIPGLLRALSQLDFEEEKEDVAKSFQIVLTLREITGINFNFRPMMTRQGFGMGGMTKATPGERVKAVRQWFGWWQENGKAWKKKAVVDEPESWDDLVEDDDKTKTKTKKKK